MTVRLENIVDDSPLKALSMTVHIAFVDDSKCVDDIPIEIVDDSPVGKHCR
jgi:hypothetical protein